MRCHGGEKDKFLNFATIYIVFLLKNVANESKAFRSLLKISDYKLIRNIFALIISKQISLLSSFVKPMIWCSSFCNTIFY